VILVADMASFGAMSLKDTCPCLSDHRKMVSPSTGESGSVSSITQVIILWPCISVLFLIVFKGIVRFAGGPGSHGHLPVTVHGRLAGSHQQAAVFQVGFLPPVPVKAVWGSADRFS
jgi:hypothetical protein